MDHSNVVKLYYSLENSEYLILVMELMEGGSLMDFIVDRYKGSDHFLRDEECSIIIKNIFQGLHYMYQNKIIHHDIKPENIMLKEMGNVNSIKIADFGISKKIEEGSNTKSDSGTLIYMSPELIKKQYTEHCDSWSTGFILYILCSGGMHPIYKHNMSRDTYFNLFTNLEEWQFPDGFPLLARNLYLKLCKMGKHKRYDFELSLCHPWITRSLNGKIPLTIVEDYDKKKKKKK